MNKCIFYLPYELDEHGNGARMLRPRKMIQAFKDIGYEVFEITGYSKERRARIKELKSRIKKGEVFDFMYAESHTEPTLLTNPNHLPTHPFLDFGFFKFIKKHGIKIGLFYCDIYWKFDSYGSELPGWKRYSALKCYEYDLRQYKKHLDRFYIPDIRINDYLKEEKLADISSELPPGADNIIVNVIKRDKRDFIKEPLNIFYVGGIGKQYNITDLIKAISETPSCCLTLCCREAEWNRNIGLFQDFMCDRIEVIHKNSDELDPFYDRADICSLLFESDEYRAFAKPFKAYEYLAHEKPVISTEGTAIGRFIEENDMGWSIPFELNAIKKTLQEIIKNPEVLDIKHKNCITTKQSNLWTCRALQVVNDLTQE